MIISGVVTLSLLGVVRSDALGTWLVYHKPAYEGKIVDVETGDPIEGAVVVARYLKNVLTHIGSGSEEIHVAETLTDGEGKFKIPSFTNMMGPFSSEKPVHFIIFKSSYAVAEGQGVLEDVFTNKLPSYSESYWHARRDVVIKLAPGIVRLPKLTNKADKRSNAIRIILPYNQEATLLRYYIDEERRILEGINN